MIRLAIAAFAALIVASCNHLPPTAVPEKAAPGYSGALTADAPLVAIIRERNIGPLDPASNITLLDQALAELSKTDPAGRYRGTTYTLTKSNALARNWLVQTPLIWDRPAAAIGTGHSDELVKRIGSLVMSARESVDIAMLQPPADGAFLQALRNGVAALARSGRPITMRILIGQYPPGVVDVEKFLASLTDGIAVKGSRLSLYVGALRSCTGGADCASFSWNHAKIVAVDGRRALVGGHNMYAMDYLADDPVFDLSMEVSGPAAADASHFADALWNYVCANNGKLATVQAISLPAGGSKPGKDCQPALATKSVTGPGKTPVLSVGRLASGITDDFANQSDLARYLMLGAAQRSIHIVQQDFGFTLGRPSAIYPESVLEKLADFMLLKGGDVYIVLSNLGATGYVGGVTGSYSNNVALEDVARKIFDVAQQRSKLDYGALAERLCRQLHIAPLRFGPDANWPDGKTFANHAKFWMIDQRYFYIGSDNFYPVDLQEFGYIVDSQTAAADVMQSYWAPLWRWSKSAAISGSDTLNCVLRNKPLRKVGEEKTSAG